jgi:ABC-type branched-subunit amino acid transport system ATPase component/MFS family permease
VRSRIGGLDPRKLTRPASVLPLLVLSGLAAMTQFESAAYSVLVPDIKQSFHLSLTGLSAITVASAPLGLLLDIPVAYAGDRVRRMRLTCFGFLVFMVFSALTGLAGALSALWLVYLARMGAAAGGAFQSTSASLLADFYPVPVRPRVYFARATASAVLGALAPAAVGVIELYYSWPAPFFIFALPTALFVVLGLRLREPVRGRYERQMMGADSVTADLEDEPASLTETFRTLFANLSMRRLYYALPFLTMSAIGIGQFTSLFYQQVLHLDAASRGFVMAATEPGAVLGLLFGASVVRPLILRNPAALMRVIGASSTLAAGLLVLFALSRNVVTAAACQFFLAGALATIVPGLTTVLSLIIPPRMRTLGFATSSIWLLLGLPVLPLASVIGDDYGLRVGIIVFVPVFLLGAYILASGGAHIAGDIEKVRVSTLARAESRRQRLEGRSQLLMVRGLRAGYGQLDVLFDVDLDVGDGEMVALLGTNGAGKSTLLRVVSALLVPSAGAVMFDGRDITAADPRRIVEAGVVHVPGGRGVFPGLSVAENLGLAGRRHHGRGRVRTAALEAVLESFPPLARRRTTLAGELSGGEQQMLSLALAFLCEPRLLLIDELSLGLAPAVVSELTGRIREVSRTGVTVVLVDQSLSTALALAERAAFMERGTVRFSGPTTDLLQRDDLARAVFLTGFTPAPGSASDAAGADPDARPPGAGPPPAPVLRAAGLSKRYGGVGVLDGIDMEIRPGERVGLIGPNGAGKTTLLDLLTGVQQPDSGEVWLDGQPITGWSAHRRAAAGLSRSFQDSRLWPGLTVQETLSLGVATQAGRTRGRRRGQERSLRGQVDQILEMLHLEPFRLRFPTELSTGTRRIVELAMVVAQRPKLLLLDEPTVGIAQKETGPLAELLRQVQEELGCAMLVIEHDMAFITGLATRVIALDAGQVISEGSVQKVLGDRGVLEAYLGLDAAEVLDQLAPD